MDIEKLQKTLAEAEAFHKKELEVINNLTFEYFPTEKPENSYVHPMSISDFDMMQRELRLQCEKKLQTVKMAQRKIEQGVILLQPNSFLEDLSSCLSYTSPSNLDTIHERLWRKE